MPLRWSPKWEVDFLRAISLAFLLLPIASAAFAQQAKDDGYRGIWYANQPSGDEYVYKYSGGFATYPQQHAPIAIYAAEVKKTFFCYGGTDKGGKTLLHMVSYYDHQTGMAPRPTILLDKATGDAHDNPVLTIDARGYVWVFSNSHGVERPSYVHRGTKPYSIDSFERVLTTNFSYGQIWNLPAHGFLFLHTRYSKDSHRRLFWMTSADGRQWDEPRMLAHIAEGDYQISWAHGNVVGTAFDYHPDRAGHGSVDRGLNARTNLYYLETPDGGKTWRTAAGQSVATPLTTAQNAALVHDYQSEGLLVYLKDVNFDEQGRPVILYLTSRGYQSGPANHPRTWRTARWTGRAWEIRTAFTSDNNYDHGSLYLEPGGVWRIIAPALPGPQRFNPGGEAAMWVSKDRGASWQLAKQLTTHSARNHSYVRRPVNAHPDFYALWADGDARRPSASALYFTNQNGDYVRRLPTSMRGEFARPEIVRNRPDH
ncbi:MAG: BNR-4 repeat-containing protein [Blastocatellia bacterium]